MCDDDEDWQPPTYQSLPSEQRQVLQETMCSMLEEYLEEFRESPSSFQFDETLMSEIVPPRYADQYDYLFAKKLLVAFVGAMERIRNTELPRSVAEEMCIWTVFENAEARVRDMGDWEDEVADEIVEGLEDFRDEFFEDTDFKFLWDGRFDGVEYLDELRPANLRFGEWFQAFREERPVNPYVEGDD